MMFPPFNVEKLPKNGTELISTQFAIPRLSEDSPKGCPQTLREVRNYANTESAYGRGKTLKFVRTADIDEVHYWVWEMDDDGRFYVYVEQYLDGVTLGCGDPNHLTLEQFLIWSYLRSQYQISIQYLPDLP